ncbi:MAG: KEOPS complex subunit Pcc1 [Candidatus Bathyarchaeota archaeon]|nr:KEOPS complex subunit Pcc1 [Candidatus Bathyarchaeota archaeon]MDI6805804.1 KEOPS complex subunit Pcc1 [Candidatus Bathyarchaeia archaeon]
MKAKAIVKLKFPSKKHLEIFAKALEPEVKKPATTRSKANIEKREKFFILMVEARDTVALRATLNAYLRWINSVVNVLEVLEKQ